MSEESQIFRGDQEPQATAGQSAPKKPKAVPAAKPAPEAAITPEPVQAEAEAAPEPQARIAAPVSAAPLQELNMHIEASDLWHMSEKMKARISSLSSSTASTVHSLESQEETNKRLEKQLKSL